MKASNKALELIKKYEGFFSRPYLDPVKIPTIGYGVIKYPNGKRVTMKDPAITEKQASDMLLELLNQTYVPELNKLLKTSVNQNQFDALVSFIYNLGGASLGKSTLLKKINANPNDPSIAAEFVKWNKAGGKVLNGLTKRRKEEYELYFSTDGVVNSSDQIVSKYVDATGLNLREGAGTNYRIITELKRGDKVHVLETTSNGWSNVLVCDTNKQGWVSSKYLK